MRAPAETLAGEAGAEVKQGNHTGKFAGTDNPRHLRVLAALRRRSMTRTHVDAEAGAANGPDLIAELRRRGMEIPCERIEALDRDGKSCRPGVYYLTDADRRKLDRWLRGRRHG